jgi:uncharacterized membrane protein
LRCTPLVYFAPARELSILFGLFLGARYFKEKIELKKGCSAFLIIACGVLLSV